MRLSNLIKIRQPRVLQRPGQSFHGHVSGPQLPLSVLSLVT